MLESDLLAIAACRGCLEGTGMAKLAPNPSTNSICKAALLLAGDVRRDAEENVDISCDLLMAKSWHNYGST